jgi:glycosidase
MQWTVDPYGGFSTAKPWLKVHPNYIHRNVEAQMADPRSLLNFYKALLRLRRLHSALRGGMFIPLHHDPQRVLAYVREDQSTRILVALNFARRRSKLALGGEITHHKWELLLSNKERNQSVFKNGWLELAGYEACILIQR